VTTPTEFYRRTDYRSPAALPKGVDAWANRWIGAYRRRGGALSQLRQRATETEVLWTQIQHCTDHQLRVRILEQREIIRRGGRAAESSLLPALAAIREAAHRQLGLMAFPEQLMGALALHGGCLAEMATGEGKTLTGFFVSVWLLLRRQAVARIVGCTTAFSCCRYSRGGSGCFSDGCSYNSRLAGRCCRFQRRFERSCMYSLCHRSGQ